MSTEERIEEEIAFTPLVAAIIGAQYEHTASVTNSLIESLQHQLAEERARNEAIEERIYALCSGDWMPTTRAILRALRPSAEEIERFKEQPG